jgi:hypothetical protein
MYYGITRKSQVKEFAQDVCDVLGHGSTSQAVNMLVRTCAQETGLGTVKDRHWRVAGVGLMQIDQIPFYDVINRSKHVDIHNIQAAFGIDLLQVTHEESAFSPLISMIVARLFYKLVPDVFPDSLEGQALYYKKHYNTAAGKGTADEFIKHAKFYGVA